jgi:phage terminase large subunit
LSNREIALRLKEYKVMTICDSAEPKSIAEIQGYGVRCMGAIKGKDSIVFGIQLIQQQQLLVTKRSTNLINELRGYTWATDRNGQATGDPIETMNHLMDAMRYGFGHLLQYRNIGKYVIR